MEIQNNNKIDLVIPWVDENDPVWRASRDSYQVKKEQDASICRYRDWELLKFWFRGVEQNLPWINKVHLITCGHLPAWLNSDCPKLNIVKHEDYIPEKYLPTFSSHVIELNLHKIKGLSEQFIYSNDDTFFIAPLEKKDFFDKGLPKDCLIENVTYQGNQTIDKIINHNIGILNQHFNKTICRNENLSKWYYAGYGKKILNNIYYSRIRFFIGFENPHLPNAFIKSTFEKVWDQVDRELDQTCCNRFRSESDVNQWLIRYWQLATGNFIPFNKLKQGIHLSIGRDDQKIKECLRTKKYAIVCINDDIENIDFETEKQFLKELFENILPEKSQFEK